MTPPTTSESKERGRLHGAVPPDEAAIRAIPLEMIAAWNAGDAAAFAAPFADTADFVAFEGTHLEGKHEIEEFHRGLFETELRGTRLEGEARFVRFISPDVAAMHARCRVFLAGSERATPSRDSMQLFVVARHGGEWRVEALQNARRLTLEQQYFADELEALVPAERADISDRVQFLRESTATRGGSNGR